MVKVGTYFGWFEWLRWVLTLGGLNGYSFVK